MFQKITRREFLRGLTLMGANFILPTLGREEPPNPYVHAFYYPWYGNPLIDGCWYHWQERGHIPPADIAANFYPLLGPYSSADASVLDQHMEWFRYARIGTLVASYWGKGSISASRLPLLMEKAASYGLKVAFLFEPYGRRRERFVSDVAYLLTTYRDHPALFRDNRGKPYIYIFAPVVPEWDIAYMSLSDWHKALAELRSNETTNASFIGGALDPKIVEEIGFDGMFTYDPIDRWNLSDQWGDWSEELHQRGLLWIPSIAPGFNNSRDVELIGGEAVVIERRGGARYLLMGDKAIASSPDLISITSFNEFHEGTQIEPVMTFLEYSTYADYFPYSPFYYLYLTRLIVRKWEEASLKIAS